MTGRVLKQMPFAVARDDGGAIKFKFVTHTNEEFEFECDPNAIPEIVARLTAALEEAAARSPSPSLQSPQIIAEKSQIGVGTEQKVVILTLFPSPNCGIGFALDPTHAQKISSDLATAAAMVGPKKDRKSLS